MGLDIAVPVPYPVGCGINHIRYYRIPCGLVRHNSAVPNMFQPSPVCSLRDLNRLELGKEVSYIAQIFTQNARSGSTCLRQILSKSVASFKNAARNTEQKVKYKGGGEKFFVHRVFILDETMID